MGDMVLKCFDMFLGFLYIFTFLCYQIRTSDQFFRNVKLRNFQNNFQLLIYHLLHGIGITNSGLYKEQEFEECVGNTEVSAHGNLPLIQFSSQNYITSDISPGILLVILSPTVAVASAIEWHPLAFTLFFLSCYPSLARSHLGDPQKTGNRESN